MTREQAVITTGGKQYLVAVGDTVVVEKLDQKPDAKLEFKDELESKTVQAVVLGHTRAKKVQGRIFRNKTRSSRFPRGHRQHQTKLKIEAIK